MLSELINQTPAARRRLGGRHRQRHELAAVPQRVGSRAEASAAGRRAGHSVLAALAPRRSASQPAERSVPARCHHDGGPGMATVGPRFCPAQDSRGAAPLLLKAVLHDGARAGDRGNRFGNGRQRRRSGIESLGSRPGGVGDGGNRLRRHGAYHRPTRRAGADRTAGRRHSPHLCGPRCQSDPGRLRPAGHLVLPLSGAAQKAAGPIRLSFGGRGGLHGADIRAAKWQPPERPLAAGRAGDPWRRSGELPTTTICFMATWATP